MRDLQAVEIKLSRGSFVLRADNTALSDLEELYDKPFEEIVSNLFASLKIRDLCAVAAVFAKATHPNLNAHDVLKAAPLIEDLKALKDGVISALMAALPPKGEPATGEDSEPASAPRPFASA